MRAARFIQVGAFAEAERAWRAAARLHELPARAGEHRSCRPSDRLARVRLGPIADPRGGRRRRSHQLKRAGYADAFIVGAEMPAAAPAC